MSAELASIPVLPDFIGGRPYSIGRDGLIRIDDPALSRGHAEVRLVEGKLKLRDLGSTNGTYLLDKGEAVPVAECYVHPDQHIAMGSKIYTIKALLALAGIYVSYSEEIGLVIKSSDPEEDVVTIKTDVDELVSQTIYKLYT